MTTVAVEHLKRMQGGSQCHLMFGDDKNLYVVKFQNNPQGVRILANDYFGTKVAQLVGLNVPRCELIEVDRWLIENTPELRVDMARGHEPCKAGLQYGSYFVGGVVYNQVVDRLPPERLGSVTNLREFAGMLALDKWLCNLDTRQAVFKKSRSPDKYVAHFVDHGCILGGGTWQYRDSPLASVFPHKEVYASVDGWSSFEPWLSRIEAISESEVWSIAQEIPREWRGEPSNALEPHIEHLLKRRQRVRELIDAFRNSDRRPFPKWARAAVCSVH